MTVMKPATLLTSALLACTLVACGKKDAPSSASSEAAIVTPAANNYLSGACGSQVVSDYNSMQAQCKSTDTSDKVEACRTQATAFLQTYPGVSCNITKLDQPRQRGNGGHRGSHHGRGDHHQTAPQIIGTVKASDIQKTIDSLTSNEGVDRRDQVLRE